MEANGGEGKSALLSQIREGAQLKKVEQKERPVSSAGRDALLDQIRQGIQLKPVRIHLPHLYYSPFTKPEAVS